LPFLSFSPLIDRAAAGVPRLWWLALSLLLLAGEAAAQARVDDIRIEGLQRISAESVFAVLPIEVGQPLDAVDSAAAIRAIFATENFQDIQLAVEDGVLLVNVQERPSISEINIDGNKAIETESLLKGLREQGLAEGRVFRRATLEGMRRELARQYGAQGRYDAEITTDVVAKPRNRVAVDVSIDEGSVAKIRRINLVGNTVFDDDQLRELMELKDRSWLPFFSSKQKYSREKLTGDLEALSDFYLDRGYIQFDMRAVQVAIGPEKNDIYITLNMDEGEQYQVDTVSLAGEVRDQAEKLQQVFLPSKGQVFSQALVTHTEKLMKRVMGNEGYTFAEIKSIPEVDEENKTVDITFFVEPKKRSYVRRIEFSGNHKTQDEVLRREMRQMEAAVASTELIELSRVRLQRLGFFKEAAVETPQVAGSEDLVDVKFRVEEQSSGSVSASLGYSQDVGLIFGADLQQNNFLGSGKQVSVQANRSQFRTSYGLSYINPYYTEDGVSRGFSVFFRETDFKEINVASYSTNSYGGSVIFGYPIDETQSLRFSAGYTHTEVQTGYEVVQEISRTPLPLPGYEVGSSDYLNSADYPSDPANTVIDDDKFKETTADLFAQGEPGFLDLHGDQFGVFLLNGSWRESTLNRGMLATRGHSNSLQLELAVPGSELEYFRLTYRGQRFLPLGEHVTLRLRAEVGYGGGYGETEELPFFEHFFAGGFGSVRGFQSNTLGPASSPALIPVLLPAQSAAGWQDVYLVEDGRLQSTPRGSLDSFGGNFLLEGSVELLFPLPFVKDQRSSRAALFYDAGNVFSSHCRSTQLNCSDFDLAELRSSVGVAITWLTGVGPLSFSFGLPLEYSELDERESFQFSLGRAF